MEHNRNPYSTTGGFLSACWASYRPARNTRLIVQRALAKEGKDSTREQPSVAWQKLRQPSLVEPRRDKATRRNPTMVYPPPQPRVEHGLTNGSRT
jgi:hypothetical protein